MRYYVVSDTHGFYKETIDALTVAGFFSDSGARKLIINGDFLDRGPDSVRMQNFISEMMDSNQIVLVRGNHEDLFASLATEDQGFPYQHHIHNGTYLTALELTGMTYLDSLRNPELFCKRLKQTVFFQKIIPASVDYFETRKYVFVHGWIPCFSEDGCFVPKKNWRHTSKKRWMDARWINGIEASLFVREPGKTIICGHWSASYGHLMFDKTETVSEKTPDYSPYYGHGIIALDACTTISGFVNCIILEDD